MSVLVNGISSVYQTDENCYCIVNAPRYSFGSWRSFTSLIASVASFCMASVTCC